MTKRYRSAGDWTSGAYIAPMSTRVRVEMSMRMPDSTASSANTATLIAMSASVTAITVALEEARLAVRHHPFQLVIIDDRPLLRFHRLVHLVWHVFLLERRISKVGTYYHEDRAGR